MDFDTPVFLEELMKEVENDNTSNKDNTGNQNIVGSSIGFSAKRSNIQFNSSSNRIVLGIGSTLILNNNFSSGSH